MRHQLRIAFGILVSIGLSIFCTGMLMNLTGIGTYTQFYKFFNDNVWGWVIMFGSMLVGFIGLKVT